MKSVILGIALGGMLLAAPAVHAITSEEFKAAADLENTQCAALTKPFEGGVLDGKYRFWNHKSSDALLNNGAFAAGDEISALRDYARAEGKCIDALRAFQKTYRPGLEQIEAQALEQRRDVWDQLRDKKITYGAANRMVADIIKIKNAREQALYPPAKNAAAAPSEADAAGMMQTGAPSK